MREIYIKNKAGLLPIGRRGENLATRVIYPGVPAEGQTVTVFAKRNGDSVAYPASSVEITDTEVIWTVTSVDTDKQGRGQVQYRYANSETGEVIKTEIFGFVVGLAIDTEVGPAPDPYESIVDRVADLVAEAKASAEQAETDALTAQESARVAQEARDDVLSAGVVLNAESDGEGTVTISAKIGG